MRPSNLGFFLVSLFASACSSEDDVGSTATGGTGGSPEGGTGGSTNGLTASSVTQHGITFSFSQPHRIGQYANGDYWVLGPVRVDSITPDYDGAHHGWEINPDSTSDQGFDERIANFDESRIPSLPHEAAPGSSLLKTLSLEPLDDASCRPCTRAAAVLTVVGEIPPDEGRTVFRPPYFGDEKPHYSTEALRMELIPSLAPAGDPPTFEDIANGYDMVQVDHKVNWTGRPLHPEEAMPDYGSAIASRNAASAIGLMLEGTTEDKWQAVVRYVNNGLDIVHMMRGGVTWPPGGGHGEGRKLPAVMAAVLLDDAQMMADLRDSGREVFGENGGMYHSDPADTVLFGQTPNSVENYWRNLVFDTGSRTIIDPYEMIDGGHRPGGSYQFCCTAKAWKATATALRLMPELLPVFNHDHFLTYVDRWVSFGAHTQPDPCAPPDGVCAGGDAEGAPCTSANEAEVCTGEDASCDLTVNWDANYGVTYGPDGQGGCILDEDPSDGTGRFPQLHGVNADGGHHGSAFADAMWGAYSGGW
jgi:hypothetical protein